MVLRQRDDESPDDVRRDNERMDDMRRDDQRADITPERSEQMQNDRPAVLKLQREREGLDQPTPISDNMSQTVRPDDSATHGFVPTEEAGTFRSRWQSLQTGFVDDPRDAVSSADALLSDITSRITQRLNDERTQLGQQWTRSDNLSTEDLRQMLHRYRSLFDRLLAS